MNKKIIFVVIDGLRKDFVSFGTQGLKKFIDNGTFFGHLITHSPETFSSIGTYLTGLYPFKHKSGCDGFKDALSLFDYLRPTHKLFMQAYHPPFGHSFTINEYEEKFGYIGEQRSRETMGLNPDISLTLKFLEENKEQQSFAYLHFFTLRFLEEILHNKIDFLSQQGRIDEIIDAYKESIQQVDKQIYRLWEFVKDKQDDYLVVITADHGESYKLYDNRILGDSGAAWASHNGCRYEEAINIPLILYGSDTPKNNIIKKQVRQIDIFPTIAKNLGLIIHTPIDGEYIELNDDKIIEKPVFVFSTHETLKKAVCMPDGFKLIYDLTTIELFNLKNDPKEQTNLAETMSDKVKEIMAVSADIFIKSELTKRDIISKYCGWERLEDNWEIMKDRFCRLNIDDWRNKAKKYNEITGVNSKQYRCDILNQMQLKKEQQVLEVGIGTGIASKYLLQVTPNVFGVDISPTMLSLVDKDIKTYIGLADKLPFKDKFFDVVFGRQIYHNLNEQLDLAIIEAKRVLKDKGKFIIAEFIPPEESFAKEWNLLRVNHEKRSFNNLQSIINVFEKHQFSNILTKIGVIKQASLNNWLDNWCESKTIKDWIYSKFLSASEAYKDKINFKIVDNDILFDMHYGIVSGEKI